MEPKINIEIVKTFASAAIRAVKEQCSTRIEVGAPSYRREDFPCPVDVASIVDVKSKEFQGTMALCYPRATFLGMVQAMTGESHQIINASVRDGSAELLNIIFGELKSTMNKQGHDFPLAIPQVLLADAAMEKLLQQEPAILIPFTTQHGPFFAQIGLPKAAAPSVKAANLGAVGEGCFPADTRILIVDDMSTMRKVVRRTLHGLGYGDVTEASDGAKAWEAIGQACGCSVPFGLVISDWNMPVMTGLDLLKKVRGVQATRATPFVLLTAESELKQITAGAEAGVSAYVLKPFTPETLSAKLKEVYAKTAGKKKAA